MCINIKQLAFVSSSDWFRETNSAQISNNWVILICDLSPTLKEIEKSKLWNDLQCLDRIALALSKIQESTVYKGLHRVGI